MSEHYPAVRDMSRAHWQRSVGQVAMTRFADSFFAERTTVIDCVDEDFYTYLEEKEEYDPWLKAHIVGEDFLVPTSIKDRFPTQKQFQREIQDYTFHKVPLSVFREAMETQVHFPLNICEQVVTAAKEQQIKGFPGQDMSDIAALLRRPDFQQIVLTAAFTRNGVWKFASTHIAGQPVVAPEFTFTNGTVDLAPEVKQVLLDELKDVNRLGMSKGGRVERNVSSGCPVVHDKPHFNDSEHDQERLAQLTDHYGVSAEELIKPRDHSVIIDGINLLADRLDHVHTQLALRKQRRSERELV